MPNPKGNYCNPLTPNLPPNVEIKGALSTAKNCDNNPYVCYAQPGCKPSQPINIPLRTQY